MALSARFRAHDLPWLRLSPAQLEARARVLAKIADGTYAFESAPCFCGSTSGDTEIAARDRYGLPVRTVMCNRCGLLRSDPRMDADSTARFYQDDYRDLYTGPQRGEQLFESQVARGRGLVSLLAKLLPTIDTVYEIGCGAGGLLLPFAEQGKRVRGVDLGSEYLEVGRAHGLVLTHGTSDDLLREAGEPADLVLLMHVLEHYLDLRDSIEQTMHLVRPGGLLLVEVPGIGSIADGYRGDVLSYLQNAHNFHFTAATLEMVLRGCGLDVLACTEHAVALCQKPETTTGAVEIAPVAGAADTVLRTLLDLERGFLQRAAAGRAA
jgi:2-polyprenyl-3-methyl-5-hydroxy-6-metoxy-1,4-benzoquinol methylase